MERPGVSVFQIDYPAIGRRVRARRERAGLTQAALAARVGVSTSFIGHIERGEKKASVETFALLAGTLGASLDELVLGVTHACTDTDCPLRRDFAAFVRAHGF